MELKPIHIELLCRINQECTGGPMRFPPVGTPDTQLGDYQHEIHALLELEGEGYVEFAFTPHQESQTGNMWYDLVCVSGLTDKGKQSLEDPIL